MSKPQDRSVVPRLDGKWSNQRNDGSAPTSIHATQEAAVQQARHDLAREGGGELSIHGRNGQIRQKDTVAPGNDPRDTPG